MNKVGPSLWHVVGRPSASIEGFMYSDAMKAHNVTWNFDTLDIYLKSPQTVVKGTKMGFMGIADDQKRHDLIAYLKAEMTPLPADAASASASN